MKRRAPDLTIHGVTAEAWAKRFDIEPCTHPCQNCGVPKTSTIPFARGTLRGLMSPPCATCGDEAKTPYCLVRDPKHGDLFSGDLTK